MFRKLILKLLSLSDKGNCFFSTGQYMIFNVNDALNNYTAYFFCIQRLRSHVYDSYLFDTTETSINNQVMEDFSISEPIEGGNSKFSCYITF